MKLAKRLFTTDLAPGWKGLYSPFGHKVAFIEKNDWGHLVEGKFDLVKSEMIEYLKENNFLVEENFEQEWLNQVETQSSIAFNWMYLVLTTECNLACKYCAVLGNEALSHPENIMLATSGIRVVTQLN